MFSLLGGQLYSETALKTNERYGRWVGASWRQSQLNMKAGWTHS